jgi:hypothetical protein
MDVFIKILVVLVLVVYILQRVDVRFFSKGMYSNPNDPHDPMSGPR